jgi:hypothetical protein
MAGIILAALIAVQSDGLVSENAGELVRPAGIGAGLRRSLESASRQIQIDTA